MPLAKVFGQGFLTNVLNPKVALFFLAFVPQFIDAATPNKALAFIVLGCIFNLNGMLWCNALAWFSARASAQDQTRSQGRDLAQSRHRRPVCLAWSQAGSFQKYLSAQ